MQGSPPAPKFNIYNSYLIINAHLNLMIITISSQMYLHTILGIFPCWPKSLNCCAEVLVKHEGKSKSPESMSPNSSETRLNTSLHPLDSWLLTNSRRYVDPLHTVFSNISVSSDIAPCDHIKSPFNTLTSRSNSGFPSYKKTQIWTQIL